MVALFSLASVVLLAVVGFALGRRWRSDTPAIWAAAAAGLQLLLFNVLRRSVFDAPSETTGNALYREGAISFAEADRIAEAATRAGLASAGLAAVGTLAILAAVRSVRGAAAARSDDASEDVQLVGQSCAQCRERIVFGSDGAVCPRCRAPIHVSCEAPHRASCGPQGYRG